MIAFAIHVVGSTAVAIVVLKRTIAASLAHLRNASHALSLAHLRNASHALSHVLSHVQKNVLQDVLSQNASLAVSNLVVRLAVKSVAAHHASLLADNKLIKCPNLETKGLEGWVKVMKFLETEITTGV